MKFSQWIGIAAALLLAAACFMPWAYFPDLGKEFTGFFSEQNRYGRPGKLLTFFSAVMIVMFVIPKVWAKRTNMIIAGITVAFVISLKANPRFGVGGDAVSPYHLLGQ